MKDFYVGYFDPPPPRIRRFLRRVALATLAASAVAATVVALGHRALPAAHFEFGHLRAFEGFVVADPYPSLFVRDDTGRSRYLLTAPGKFGADDLVASVVGRAVSLQGTLVYRNNLAMIQVEPGTVAPWETVMPPPELPEVDLGTRYVEGEIVGSKCYLGVMNPGSGVTHRACATVCIRGGVPPLLEVRREDGRREGIVLAGTAGEAIGDWLQALIATPVGATGRLVRRGGTTFLYVDPAQIRRLQMTRPERGMGLPGESGVSAPRRRHAAGFPIAEAQLPPDVVKSGPYRLTFARTVEDLRVLQRLRFEVFNLELGEGLASSFESGLDEDDLDEVMHHILISDTRTGDVVGTYRMQTAAMAAANSGFYTSREFDFSGFPMQVIDDAVEVGRACIAKDHRSRRVLHLLWRGLAVYLTWTGKHHLFGCCSLTTQDRRVGNAAHAFLVERGHLHPHARAWPLPGFECGLHDHGDAPGEPVDIPPLFQSYLNLGAKICGPPAIDRKFQTIDFPVVLDVRGLEQHVYRNFFG